MDTKEIKTFIIDLIDRELEEEYDYQFESEKDTTYIKQLLQAKQYLMKNAKGFDKFINALILKEDVDKYLNMKEYKRGE